MARKVFQVLIDNEVVATKYAFNTARRAIPAAIRDRSEVGDVWELVKEDQKFDDMGLNRVYTFMVWERPRDGEILIAEVTDRV